MRDKRIILAGGSGFIGSNLRSMFLAHNYDVVVLTRHPKPANDDAREVQWDGRTISSWTMELNGAEAVINLTGRSINCRYTPENRRAILESRVQSTEVLGKAIGTVEKPPRVWMNASTATIYKQATEIARDESGEIGATTEARDGFSVEVAHAWEAAFNAAVTRATRKITLRTSLVFGLADGGVFRVLRRLARLGLGGKMGSGGQYVSWIHENDFARAIIFLLQNDTVTGPVNLAAPTPLTNQEMMRVMRNVSGAPLGIGLPAARWMLEVGAFFMRTETELILKSRRVFSKKLLEAGFKFDFPNFEDAVRDLEARVLKK